MSCEPKSAPSSVNNGSLPVTDKIEKAHKKSYIKVTDTHKIAINREIVPPSASYEMAHQNNSSTSRLDWDILDKAPEFIKKENAIDASFEDSVSVAPIKGPLQKIRSIIHTKRQSRDKNIENIVELTNSIDMDRDLIDDLSMSSIQESFGRVNLPFAEHLNIPDTELKEIARETMRPYLQEWMRENIANLVRDVVQTEVKSALTNRLQSRSL